MTCSRRAKAAIEDIDSMHVMASDVADEAVTILRRCGFGIVSQTGWMVGGGESNISGVQDGVCQGLRGSICNIAGFNIAVVQYCSSALQISIPTDIIGLGGLGD